MPRDAWCCEMLTPETPCGAPADFQVFYGDGPDDMTLMCKPHVQELWQPTWEVQFITPQERELYAVEWADVFGPDPTEVQ